MASKNELSYTVKKSSGSLVVLDAMKTFSVEDRLFKMIESRSKKLNIPTTILVRELILSGIEYNNVELFLKIVYRKEA